MKVLLTAVFLAFAANGFAQKAARQDSLAMTKTIDSLKKEIVKKDKQISSFTKTVRKLTALAFPSDDDIIAALSHRGYFIMAPNEDFSDFAYNKWRCRNMILAIQLDQ